MPQVRGTQRVTGLDLKNRLHSSTVVLQLFYNELSMLRCLSTVISISYDTSNRKPPYFIMELLFYDVEKIKLYYLYSKINFNGELPESDKILGLWEGYLRSGLGLRTLMVLDGKETGYLILSSVYPETGKVGCNRMFL